MLDDCEMIVSKAREESTGERAIANPSPSVQDVVGRAERSGVVAEGLVALENPFRSFLVHGHCCVRGLLYDPLEAFEPERIEAAALVGDYLDLDVAPNGGEPLVRFEEACRFTSSSSRAAA